MALLCRDIVPDVQLPEVRAFLDWRAFGVLPASGGTMDQPAWLMDGLRRIHSEVSEAERRRAPKAPKGGR